MLGSQMEILQFAKYEIFRKNGTSARELYWEIEWERKKQERRQPSNHKD